MSKKAKIRILVVGTTCVVLLSLRVAYITMVLPYSSKQACINNMRQLEEAAAKYRLEAKGAPVSLQIVPLSGSNQVTAPR
jgi:hypothetical protein